MTALHLLWIVPLAASAGALLTRRCVAPWLIQTVVGQARRRTYLEARVRELEVLVADLRGEIEGLRGMVACRDWQIERLQRRNAEVSITQARAAAPDCRGALGRSER